MYGTLVRLHSSRSVCSETNRQPDGQTDALCISPLVNNICSTEKGKTYTVLLKTTLCLDKVQDEMDCGFGVCDCFPRIAIMR